MQQAIIAFPVRAALAGLRSFRPRIALLASILGAALAAVPGTDPLAQRAGGVGRAVADEVESRAPRPNGGEHALLVFSETESFRHDSIPAGAEMLLELADEQGFTADHSEDSSVFNDEALARYGAVVFLSTTGDVLNDAEQAAFERFVRGGGGYVGIHAAADTEHEWPWYGDLVGARFRDHPAVQTAFVEAEDAEHPSTRMLPARWERRDEWYNYDRNPRAEVHVLLTVDEESYEGGSHAGDHPIAWCREFDGGRTWYTGLGHTAESFDDPSFRAHVLGGLRWALGIDEGDCAAWTTADDHRSMMRQLGITKLRPGRNADADAPNAANYDEALANPFPVLPDPLTTNDGRAVTSAEMWFDVRRPEIVEHFEREVVGRVPEDVPDVEWIVVETAEGMVGDRPVVGKRLVGRVDNSAYPAITVEIQMTLVTPAEAAGPVPVMMMFGGARSIPGGVQPEGGFGFGFGPRRPGPGGPPAPSDPPAAEQLIAAGWGYSQISPTSIQADNGAGLTKGIIGLVNRGGLRKPDDWGALRAWAWGASRGLDHLETEPSVDATRVGIEGVSRYGKAALITMAFDERFAVVLVGSSGEGGAKLHRRNFGEAVENLTGSGEYHWMAGNFLKYGAEESVFGSMNAGDIPVDAHGLIALCAPRAVFISYGIPERGDALWLDQQGSFMAAVAAGPVFRLLGVKDLGVSDDYNSEKKPPVNVGLLDGHLAWRQHDGGHTDGPNWKHFIPWASRLLGITAAPVPAASAVPRVSGVERTDANSRRAHRDLLEKARNGRIDVYFAGDSITRRWGALDYPELLAHWNRSFYGWNAGNFGWGGDTTRNILWRIRNGELDGVNPKLIVLLAGTNDIGAALAAERPVDTAGIARGIEAIVAAMQEKAPEADIVLMAIFPRDDRPRSRAAIEDINRRIASLADGERVRFLDINKELTDANGALRDDFSRDGLHLTAAGYEVWASALKPLLTARLGPPSAEDLAPPPTGDPSAVGRLAR